jgi:hypothetical protein
MPAKVASCGEGATHFTMSPELIVPPLPVTVAVVPEAAKVKVQSVVEVVSSTKVKTEDAVAAVYAVRDDAATPVRGLAHPEGIVTAVPT